MRYTSAVVLSTLAVGQAAAAGLRHSSFHARRAAEKRDEKAVDWTGVAYDLKNVDWEKVDWKSVFNKDTPAATPTPEVEQPKVQNYQTSAAPEPAYTPAPEAEVKPSSTKEAKPEKTEESNPIEEIGEKIGNDIKSGLASFIKKLGIIKEGVNADAENGGIWLGSSSKWTAGFTNSCGKDLKLFCWEAKGFDGMSLNVNQPAISINLAPGASQTLSFAEGVPASCAPADDSTELALFGGIKNTWWEVTFGSTGAFDVSRNVWMHGTNINSTGSKCTSNMDECVFKCKDDKAESCEKGYDLFACESKNGGGGGYDPIMDGTGGGCAMGSDGEHVDVNFY